MIRVEISAAAAGACSASALKRLATISAPVSRNRRFQSRPDYTNAKLALDGQPAPLRALLDRADLILSEPGGAVIDPRAQAHDISAAGFRAETRVPLAEGQRLAFEIILDGGSRVRGLAEVIWISQDPWGAYVSGAKIRRYPGATAASCGVRFTVRYDSPAWRARCSGASIGSSWSPRSRTSCSISP